MAEIARSDSNSNFKRNIIVLKIGTSSLINAKTGVINISMISRLATVAADLRTAGYRIVIVSSGAIGVGCVVMELDERPKTIPGKQAMAAIGQGVLHRYWTDVFSALKIHTAQILLTYENLSVQSQFENARNTMMELLDRGVIPIVNENDTVAVEEIRWGDNDTLSALVASCTNASWLFLLTDVDGLYSANPRTDPNATKLDTVNDIENLLVDTAGGDTGTQWGSGGMATKLTAARVCVGCDCDCVIMSSNDIEKISERLEGAPIGTLFVRSSNRPVSARKRWLLSCKSTGKIIVDMGARRALSKRNSLFAAGIKGVNGTFNAQAIIEIEDTEGCVFGKGVSNYSSEELNLIKGLHSSAIPEKLGYFGQECVIHRDNILRQATQ